MAIVVNGFPEYSWPSLSFPWKLQEWPLGMQRSMKLLLFWPPASDKEVEWDSVLFQVHKQKPCRSNLVFLVKKFELIPEKTQSGYSSWRGAWEIYLLEMQGNVHVLVGHGQEVRTENSSVPFSWCCIHLDEKVMNNQEVIWLKKREKIGS